MLFGGGGKAVEGLKVRGFYVSLNLRWNLQRIIAPLGYGSVIPANIFDKAVGGDLWRISLYGRIEFTLVQITR